MIDASELTEIYENQAAKMLLNKEALLITKLAHDGMITLYDSELELKRINRDLNNIESLRKAHSKYVFISIYYFITSFCIYNNRKLITKYRKRGSGLEILIEKDEERENSKVPEIQRDLINNK